MKKLDYGTQLNPFPIKLSIGTLKKPKLKDIVDSEKFMSFDEFRFYELLITMTPESFYQDIKGDSGKVYWDSLSNVEKSNLTIYQIIKSETELQDLYVRVFNFFFEERVEYKEGFFVLFKEKPNIDSEDIATNDICGAISEETFPDVINLIQQICCVDDKTQYEEMKFKNEIAKKLYEKMLKANKEKKSNINHSLPNIISTVSNNHQSINPINVWELTVFQLIDTFNRLNANHIYDIQSMRVSVWGDEKKTFDSTLWYKNEYDKN